MSEPERDLFGAIAPASPPRGASLYLSTTPAIATAFGEEEVRVLQGPGLSAIIQERLSQISRRGYSLETDIARGPAHLAEQARRFLGAAIEQLQPGERQAIDVAQKNLIRAGAMTIAALDSFTNGIGAARAPFGAGDDRTGSSPRRSAADHPSNPGAGPAHGHQIASASDAIGGGHPARDTDHGCSAAPVSPPAMPAGPASEDLIFNDPDFEGNPDVND